LLILGLAVVLPAACAEGVQDNAPAEGFDSAATGNVANTGDGGATSGGGRGGAANGGATSGGAFGAAGSPSGGASSGGNGTSGSATGGSATGGSATGGSTTGGTASGGKAGSGTAGASAGAPAGGAPAGGAPAGGAPAGGAPAGGAPAGGAGGATGATGFYVQYLNQKTATSSPYISCTLRVINNGTGTVAVNSLKLRYYLTNDPVGTLQMMNNYQHIAIPGNQADLTVTTAFVKMTPVTNADTYIEFSFSSGHPMLAPQEVLEYSWQVQDTGNDSFNQSNDYSFDASKTALAPWDHVVLYQSGSVIWGTPP
jgi:hypothetical protein